MKQIKFDLQQPEVQPEEAGANSAGQPAGDEQAGASVTDQPAGDEEAGTNAKGQSIGDATAKQEKQNIADLRKARRTRSKPFERLIPYLEMIQRFGLSGHFSYQDLVEAVAFRGCHRVSRNAMRRFVQRYVPEVFAMRSQCRHNRNAPKLNQTAHG
jgi:hypothetical protein